MPKVKKWFKRRCYLPDFAIKKLAINVEPARATVEFDVVSEQHLVPLDENLLERSRTQWQLGDWASPAANHFKPRVLAQHNLGSPCQLPITRQCQNHPRSVVSRRARAACGMMQAKATLT